VVFVDAADEAHIEAAHKHPLSREFDSRRRMKIFNKDEVGASFMPAVRLVLGFPRARGVMSFLNFHRHSPTRQIQNRVSRTVHRPAAQAGGRCLSEPAFTPSAKRAWPSKCRLWA